MSSMFCAERLGCRSSRLHPISQMDCVSCSNGLLLRDLCSSPSLSYLLFGDIMFAHLCGSWSWFLIPASAQQWHWQEVSSPGWLTGTICCPGTFSPLSVVKNPGGRTGSAWAG